MGKTWTVAGWRLLLTRPARRERRSASEPRRYPEASDAELLAWSEGGDRRAFEEIVVRHGGFALRLATRLLKDPAAAEDVVQEAMVRIWSQAGRFDPDRARFTTWLYRIVSNLCVDQQRRVRSEPMPEDFDPPDPADGICESLEACQRREALAEARGALPERQREAMALVYDEGMSGAEAAQALGLSVKAVERLLARARDSLRKRLRTGQV